MLSTSRAFLFIHVPKTAGNSIQDALRGYSDDAIVALSNHQDGVERFELRSDKYQTTKHSTLSEYEREYGAEMVQRLFKFTCVRNPWDRCMSHYFSPHRGEVDWDKQKFLDFVKTQVKPIPHYLSRIALQPIDEAVSNVDFVIRYEDLESGFRSVCKHLALPSIQLLHRNASPQQGQRAFYDLETTQIVNALFQEEIEYFGYKFDGA